MAEKREKISDSISGDIPTKLSDLSDDSTHRVVTDAEKASWTSATRGVRIYVQATEPIDQQTNDIWIQI